MHHLYPHISLVLPRLEAWIESWIGAGGPIVVFLVTFVEGIPPIGLLSPSHTVVFFAVFLAKIGVLRFDAVLSAALGGMILGDIVGYFMGKRYGYSFLIRLGKMFSVRKESVEKLKGLVSGHLVKALFIGKFNPLTRALAPFTVGASKVSFGRFLFVDILANASWTALAFVIGYAFGASYAIAAAYLGRIIVIGIVIVILTALTYRFASRQFHVFARYELFSLIAFLIALFGFAAMLQGISGRHDFMLGPDVAVNIWFGGLASMTPWLVSASTFISNVFGPVALTIAFIGLPVYLLIKKRWKHLFITLSSLGGGYIIAEFLKGLIASPRPPDALVFASGFSFPSEHAVFAAVILVLVVYFFAPLIKARPWRWTFIAAALVLALIIVASRLILGVHWLSDVVAGLSLGILSATAMILLVRYSGLAWRAIADLGKEGEEPEKVL